LLSGSGNGREGGREREREREERDFHTKKTSLWMIDKAPSLKRRSLEAPPPSTYRNDGDFSQPHFWLSLWKKKKKQHQQLVAPDQQPQIPTSSPRFEMESVNPTFCALEEPVIPINKNNTKLQISFEGMESEEEDDIRRRRGKNAHSSRYV
jgi:hypothetical protein